MKRLKERVQVGTTPDGKPIYQYADGYSAQELQINVARLLLESGQLTAGSTTVRAKPIISPTFRQYAEEWMRLFKIPKLRHTTLNTYQNLLKKHLYPAFGSMRLNEISLRDIQTFYNQHSDMAKSSIKQMAIILHQIFALAVDDGLVKRNMIENKRLFIDGHKEHRREALSDNAIRSIIENIPRLSPEEQIILSVLVFTGMRRGEALGLRWEDIDWKQQLISIERGVTFHNNQPVLGETKSRAGIRKIPLDKELAAILSPYRQLNGYLIGDGITPITERTFIRMWDRIKNKIELFGATPHVLRHTYITLCASTDMDVKNLQTIAGHSDVRMTLDRYAHSREEKIIEAGHLVDEVFSSLK